MSNYAPGWYPDGSGRYAQRYYDGSHWTAHVLDASGQRGEDHVPGVTVGAPQAQVAAIPAAAAPYTSPQQPWGQASRQQPADDRYRPSTGTSSSSFQFASAPTHDSAYAKPGAPVSGAPAAVPGFRPTVGLLVVAGGLIAVALAVLVLGFWSGGGFTASLGDISAANTGVNGLVTAYANIGRWVGLVVVAAIAVIAALDAMGNTAVVKSRDTLTIATVVAAGLFALWHLVALFLTPDTGGAVDVGPAIAGFVGVIGYAATAASPYLRHPLGRP